MAGKSAARLLQGPISINTPKKVRGPQEWANLLFNIALAEAKDDGARQHIRRALAIGDLALSVEFPEIRGEDSARLVSRQVGRLTMFGNLLTVDREQLGILKRINAEYKRKNSYVAINAYRGSSQSSTWDFENGRRLPEPAEAFLNAFGDEATRAADSYINGEMSGAISVRVGDA